MPCVCLVYLEFMFEMLYLCVVKLLRTYKNSYYSMNKEFWSEGNLESLIDRTYSIAEEHGFHDTDLSIPHMMMLVLTEICEAVDADRHGRFHFSNVLHPKMATTEEWKSVCACPDYEVSNFGRVRSRDMKVWGGKVNYTKKGRLLKAGLSGTGYYTVSLRGKTYKVAKLVAEAFLEKKNSSYIVNHIDGNKKNDNIGNLEWVSSSDNNTHALKTGLRRAVITKVAYEDRVYIAHQYKLGRTFTSIMKDKDFGVTKSAIHRICKEGKKYTDSVEFELADVCIRIFDTCGELGIMPNIPKSEDYMSIWREMFAEESFCELMYELSCLVTEAHEDSSSEELSDITGAALLFVACLCEYKGIDLERHIELKMDYNEHRPYLNGKKY